MFDLVIIGGGPAGVAAGVYASRKRLKTLFITDSWGGQSSVSDGIENWIGTVKITGLDLGKNLKNHLKAYAGDIVLIKEKERVELIEKQDGAFLIKTNKGNYTAKTVLISTGSARRKLEVPGAETYDNKGLTYCATCDGPLFADKDVAVIGGGNAGFDSAAQLLAYCKSVTLLHKYNEFKADPSTVQKVLENPKMKGVLNAEILEVKGDLFVKGLVYKDKTTDIISELPVEGIFVEIGSIPTTSFAKNVLALDEYNRIITDPKNQRTGTEGIWAAGDATDGLFHQNNIAAGDAVKALEDIYLYLHTK